MPEKEEKKINFYWDDWIWLDDLRDIWPESKRVEGLISQK